MNTISEEYKQAKINLDRLFLICDQDIILTFKVLNKLVSFAQSMDLKHKYINVGLVLTYLILTDSNLYTLNGK